LGVTNPAVARDSFLTKHTMKVKERQKLLQTLKTRFERNGHCHEGIVWGEVEARLEGSLDALRSLHEMEATSGEPDVVGHDTDSGQLTFCDCSAESPVGRRTICYVGEALDSRKEHKPENSAVDMAAAMGIDLLTEAQYLSCYKPAKLSDDTPHAGRSAYRLGIARLPQSMNAHPSVAPEPQTASLRSAVCVPAN
jgi:hypothetical protein